MQPFFISVICSDKSVFGDRYISAEIIRKKKGGLILNLADVTY